MMVAKVSDESAQRDPPAPVREHGRQRRACVAPLCCGPRHANGVRADATEVFPGLGATDGRQHRVLEP